MTPIEDFLSAGPAIRDAVLAGFVEQFGGPASLVVRAPGRVNLMGEHTDYNGGFVLPMAIDRATWIALRPRADRTVVLHSLNYHETASFDLLHLVRNEPSWSEYAKGVAWALQENGPALDGWEGVTKCDVPMGAGLASSASFELAVARAFFAVGGMTWDATKMAQACQKAENRWVGVNCGIMDQMISAVGKAGHAALIDCRDLSIRSVPLPTGTAVVVMDTATRRGLVESAYNERREQCEAAARHFGVASLRDVTMETFLANPPPPGSAEWHRARHVISEIARTAQAAEAMDRDDGAALGRLMNECHESLRDDFEVSDAQLDTMVSLARQIPGCLGARMTGAGFGGCAVALIESVAAPEFLETIRIRYDEVTGLASKIYLCKPADGAELISHP
jgi:galactokinase